MDIVEWEKTASTLKFKNNLYFGTPYCSVLRSKCQNFFLPEPKIKFLNCSSYNRSRQYGSALECWPFLTRSSTGSYSTDLIFQSPSSSFGKLLKMVREKVTLQIPLPHPPGFFLFFRFFFLLVFEKIQILLLQFFLL